MDVLAKFLAELRAEKLKKEGPNICGIDDFIDQAKSEKQRLETERDSLTHLSWPERQKAGSILRFELMSLPSLKQILRQKRAVRNSLWKRMFNEELFTLDCNELIDQFVAEFQLPLYGQESLARLLLKLRRQARRMSRI